MPQHASISLLRLAACAGLLLATAACGGKQARLDERSGKAEQLVVQERQQPLEKIVRESDGPARTLRETPFDFAWDLELPEAVHASWVSENVPDLLFFQTRDGQVHGIDIYSGVTRWVSQPLPKLIKHPPYVQRVTGGARNRLSDDRVYLISGDELYVFDCHYGQLIWRHHLGQAGSYGFEAASGPYAIGQGENLRVYIGDWEGRVRVLSRAPNLRPYVMWQWNVMAVPTAQPHGKDELVYVGTHGGNMHCFAMDREMLWTYNARGAVLGSSLVRGRSLYFGADDNILHALNRLSGEKMGSLYLGAPIRRRPFAFNAEKTRLYAWSEADSTTPSGLRAIHTMDDSIVLKDVQVEYEDGKRLEVNRLGEDWFLPDVKRLVASSPQHIYLMRPQSSVVLAIDRRSGKAAYHWDLNDGRSRAQRVVHVVEYQDPTDEVRTIVTADADGMVTAYRYFGATSTAERAVANK